MNIKKLVEELSQKITLLPQKGPAYQNDIAYVTLKSSYITKMDPKNYHFELRPDLIKLYSWSYRFYNAVDKKIKDCKIYSPFTHLKNRRKLQSIYSTHQSQNFELDCEYYKYINAIFTYDTTNKQWHAINPNSINEVNSKIINNKEHFVVSKFMNKFYVTEKKELVMF